MAEAWEIPSTKRVYALDRAIDSLPDDTATRTILDRAELFFQFIIEQLPVRLVISFGPVVDQATHTPQGTIGGGTGMAQLHDDQQVDVTVRALDAKGFETDVDLQATSDDDSVATVTELEDGKTFRIVAGSPGSTIVHVRTGDLEGTLAVDVKPGNVALLRLEVGEPVAQAPADAPPADQPPVDAPPADQPPG